MKLRELLQQMIATQQRVGSSDPFICGGTPRDRYLKHLENISDLDLTTGDKSVDILSEEFAEDLSRKYNVTRRKMEDGHSSIYIGSFKMDFSSNFNVPGIDVLLAKQGIAKPTEMQKEMFSRDFTCNALLLSLDLKNLIDPTHRGFKDIKDKMIRTCLTPDITLTSNKNRVVRAIYLASKLDFDIDPTIIEYVRKNPKSVKISTERAMAEKLNEAFNRDGDKAAYYVTKMGLWTEIPITEVVRPFYLKSVSQKVAYFQGGGGVNEPTPKKKKYKSDPALVMQPRFKEPLYKNYDLYETPGEHSPGAGFYQNMEKYKSVKDFIEHKRKRNQHKYKADDSWKQDDGSITKSPNGTKARASLLSKLIKHAIDFPIDEYFEKDNIDSENGGSVGQANLTGGYLDKYLPEDDFEGKPPTSLNFGRDYSGNKCEHCGENKLDITFPCEKCGKGGAIVQEPHGLYGLPDGVDLPDEDSGDSSNINPEYGTRGPDSLIYEDKWNI